MFSLCLRYTGSRYEAEDLLQQGFGQVFTPLKNSRQAGSFEGWVRKIMLNCCIQHFRSKTKLPPVVSLSEFVEGKMIKDEPAINLGKKELLKMVQALPLNTAWYLTGMFLKNSNIKRSHC